jgi:hypothetical protein
VDRLKKTTRAVIGLFTGSQPAQPHISTLKPIVPLQAYLDKYLATHTDTAAHAAAAKLLPPAGFPMHNIRSTDVAFSLMPLTNAGQSNFYAGKFDNKMYFSASLVKAAALYAAAELLAEAKAFLQHHPTANSTTFFANFDNQLKTEIISTPADQRIRDAGVGLQPSTTTIRSPSTITIFKKWSGSPSIAFTGEFNTSLTKMIVQSSDPDAAICIRALGYGYINAALIRNGFFKSSTSNGIWLAGTYGGDTYVRIPCENDHDDAQVITTQQMCRLFSMIRLNQLPQNDPEGNGLMQSLLNEPKTGPDDTLPWLAPSRSFGVAPLFTVIQDKIGYAGLGSDEIPNVYSEGLVIRWNSASQINSFNTKLDPTNSNPGIRLSGEIAVCWQNLLAELISGDPNKPNCDGITQALNQTISRFLDQAPP